MEFWIYFFIISVIGIAALLVYFKNRTKHMRDLTKNMPGMKRFPWTAKIMHVFAENKERTFNFYNAFKNLLEIYPDISKFWIGPILLIDIRNPEYVKKILNSEKCLDRAELYSFPYETGLLASGGDLWKLHRKILNPAFNFSKLNSFMPIINSKSRKLVKALSKHVDKPAFNVIRLVAATTLESLLRTSCGLEKDFINNPYNRFFAIVKKEASDIGKKTFSTFFLPKMQRKNEFTEFCQSIYNEAEKEAEKADGLNKNFIEILLANKNHLTSKEIQDEVSTLILSGNVSTALSISSVLLMLAMHQDVQVKLVEEIKSVFNDSDDEIDGESIIEMKYLDLVVKETLRLFPIAPVIGRRATEDLQLDDKYTIPKGANLALRIIDIQRSPEFWGETADKFIPDRFLPDNFDSIHPYAYIPFSGGARICIGYRYALNAMKIILCHILKNYKVTTPLKYEELTLEISFVLRICQNYMIQLEKRRLTKFS